MASQDCPLCFSKGVFSTWNCLKDSLVSLSTRSFTCPLCFCVLEGLDKFSLHLVSHEMEAKKLQQQQVHHLHQHPRSSALQTEDAVPTISIKEGSSNIDTLDDLLADFSEFVKQEDKICYDHHQLQPKPPPNPILQEAPPLPIEPSPKLQQVLDASMANNIAASQDLISGSLSAAAQAQNLCQAVKSDTEVITTMETRENSPANSPSGTGSTGLATSSSNIGGNSSQVQCSLCGWNFDNENFLQLHMVLMHSKKNAAVLQRRMKRAVEEYKCRHCLPAESAPSFSVYEEYVNHLKVVHNDHRFVCHICAKIFKLRGSLLVHLRVVHNPLGDGAYHCGVCNRKFTNKHRRDVHQKKHSISNLDNVTTMTTQQCNQCGMTFEEKGEFEIHMETHQNAPNPDHEPYKCHQCGRSFFTQAALWIHSVGHQNDSSTGHLEAFDSNEQPPLTTSSSSLVKVPACSVLDGRGIPESSGSPTLQAPSSSSIGDKSGGFKCPTCDKVFKRESHLNQHLKVHDNKQWECDVCKKTFTTKYFLKKHKRLHTGETPYACHICGKSFTFQQSYHKHMLYHTDDKPYTCSQCGRAFKELSTLQNHERIHSGERPFACETCGKSFRQRVSYLVHRRIHTGVMPYVCNDCGKSFRYKVTQRTHKCIGKFDETTPTATPLSNPLAEENASIELNSRLNNASSSSGMIDLPQQIKEDLMSFRKSQGRRFLQDRLQGYLQKSKERPWQTTSQQSQLPSPIGNQLEHLSLSDNMNSQSQSMPNIEAILFEPTTAPPTIKPEYDPAIIKTESVDDFDLQAFL